VYARVVTRLLRGRYCAKTEEKKLTLKKIVERVRELYLVKMEYFDAEEKRETTNNVLGKEKRLEASRRKNSSNTEKKKTK